MHTGPEDMDIIAHVLNGDHCIHFSDNPVVDFASAAASNIELFKKFFHAMLKRGVYLPPSAFETWFVCNALTRADIDFTINAAKESLQEIAS